jgi:hypothetical protein
MSKFSTRLTIVGACIAVTAGLMVSVAGAAAAEVNTVTPSTNDINKANGWANVEQVSKGIGTTQLEFESTRSFASYNLAVTDGLYPFTCKNNSSATIAIAADEYVEVRMVFGAETDERFDWTRFDVLPPVCTFTTSNSTMTLDADCETTEPIVVPGNHTLNGAGHTITVPAGTLFNGGVIENTPGQKMNVHNARIVARDLATSCGVALHAIKLVDAGGSITKNRVDGLYQLEGTEISGCQNGRAIYANSTTPVTVNIAGNTVLDYQKSGIEARGAVKATILNNVVDGWGQNPFATNKIASNGVLVAFGGRALVIGNTIKDNWYTPTSDTACGLLLFEAGGLSASKVAVGLIKKVNAINSNETDICVV